MKPSTLMILLLSFGLVSCGPSMPSSPQPFQQAGGTALPVLTDTPSNNTPLSSTPMPTFAPILVPANSTVVEFLVDKSGSVDKNCPNNKRYNFVNFMVKLMKNWAQFPNAEKLYVGVAQFGSSFDPSLQPTDITTLNNFSLSPDKLGITDTLFGSAIIQAAAQMKMSEAKHRILMILTDGEFASKNIDDVESGLGKYVGQDLNVYIGLLCPDPNSPAPYVQDWYNKLDNKMIGVKVFGSAEETGVEVLKQLKVDDFLSSDFTPMFIPVNGTAKIPGYATKATFSYWSTSEQPLNVDLNGAPFVTVLSSKPELMDVDPTPNCSDTQFQIDTLNPPSRGLLLVSYATFKNIDLSINLELPANEIINNGSVVMKVTARDLNSVDFGNWRSCYSIIISPSNLSGGSITSKDCASNLSTCLEGSDPNSFYSEWNWTPLFDHSQDVMLHADLINPKYNIKFADSNVNIPIKFQATYSKPDSLVYETNPDFPGLPSVEIGTGKIEFAYVVDDPQIYLLSPKTVNDMKGVTSTLMPTDQNITWVACPTPSSDLITDFPGYSVVNLTNYKKREKLPLPAIYAKVFPQSEVNNPLAPTVYTFQTYPYVISECGYSKIEFRWSAQPGVRASAWICDIENDIISCNTDPHFQ